MNELAQQVGVRLRAAGAMLVTAESCTGGWVAQEVTSVAGSSAWFDRGFVTYTDASKHELLGVQAATVAQHGAVSEETAREMAQGALMRSPATVSLSVTGIAGPGGAVPGKPVGTVCFAWACRGGAVTSETRRFDGDREAVRRQSVVHALQGILRALDSAQ